MDVGFTMQVAYFKKTDTAEPVDLSCIPDGKIDFSLLGQELGLDPSAIKLNGTGISKTGLQSAYTWSRSRRNSKRRENLLVRKMILLLSLV